MALFKIDDGVASAVKPAAFGNEGDLQKLIDDNLGGCDLAFSSFDFPFICCYMTEGGGRVPNPAVDIYA